MATYQLLALYAETFDIPQEDGSRFILGQLTCLDLNNYKEGKTHKGYPSLTFNVPDISLLDGIEFPSVCKVRLSERGGKKGKNKFDVRSITSIAPVQIPSTYESLLISYEASQYNNSDDGKVRKRVRLGFIDTDSFYDDESRRGFKPLDIRLYDDEIQILRRKVSAIPAFYSTEFVLDSDFNDKPVKKIKNFGELLEPFDFSAVA